MSQNTRYFSHENVEGKGEWNMCKLWKKGFAVILAGTMVMGFCTSVYAEDAEVVEGEIEEVTVDEGDKP